MEKPNGCKKLKIERTCHSGFLWAFEFLNYAGVTNSKKRLHVLEDHMSKVISNAPSYGVNLEGVKFVAVVKSKLKTVSRGYILLSTPDRRGGTCDVFFIDYGTVEKVNVGDLRILPEYASVEKNPAQSWRIGIYGVLPLHIELKFGEPASKIVGDSWNGKDIIFIENVLKDYDVVEFQEVKRYQEYRFGYIYLTHAESKEVTSLQKLLVDRGYAVEVENFDKRIPSIVKRIKSTPDHVTFPTGEVYDDSDFNDSPDTPSKVDLKTAEEPSSLSHEAMSSQSSEISSNESIIAAVPVQTSPQSSISVSVPAPKVGKGRGDLMKKLLPQKAPPFQLSPMIGRMPLNASHQFDDSVETVYCDAFSSPNKELSPSSSVEFLTPRNGSPSISRRQSSILSSPIEISGVTRAIDLPETETISLITPPRNSATISLTDSRDEVPTIDLTTPPTVSLITPSPSPRDPSSSGESSSGSTSSLTRLPKGRGELLRFLSISSRSSMHSAISQDDLNERLSELKLGTVPLPAARGRGTLMSQFLNQSNSIGGTSVVVEPHNPSTNETYRTSEFSSPSRIDFAKDIVELEPISVNLNARVEEQVTLSDNDEFDSSEQQFGLMDRLLTKIMVLGNEGVCRFKPKYSINDFNLHQSIKMRASQLHLHDLRRCQRYMIGAMLTRRNVTLIDASRTGKTVSCLISLFSLLKDDKFYKALPVGPGPRAIILCPYSSQCESIDRQCKELNKSVKSSSVFPGKEILKVNVAYGCGTEAEKNKSTELTQGYDIVITTPNCLLRLLNTPEKMNLKRLCHLVLDDAYTLFNFYREEVENILGKAEACGRKLPDGLILPQQVIISKEWMPMLKSVVKKDVTEQKGVLLVGSYYEAAIFCKIGAKIRRIFVEDTKRCDLLDYLNVEASKKSTVIVFNTVEEMNETYIWLKSKCMRPMNKVSYHLGSADDIVIDWKRAVDREEYPIMCCTDSTLDDLGIHEANCLIHYNLPPQERGYFNERFSVLLNRLAGPPNFYTPGKMPLKFSKVETLIYVGSNDRRQLPVILKFYQRLGMRLREDLANECKQLIYERELEKDDNAFCENYKKFGCCMDEKLCIYRHYFSQKYDQPAADIPRQGFVKMHILQVYSASHYCVRLLEHRYGSNKWSQIKPIVHPGVLNAKVNMYFSDPSKRSMHVCEKVGEVAAIETTTNMFKRVKVLELKMRDKTDDLRTVKVKFIDDGKIDEVRPSVLVKLSDELASIPPTSVDIFLCNVLPVDRDIEWGDIISNTVRERIQFLQEGEDVLFIGEIQLVAGRDVWVNPLQCHKLYDKGKEVIAIISSMSKDLLKKNLAVDNPDHLPKLLSMYRSADLLELPESAVEPVIESPRVENDAKVRNIDELDRTAERRTSSNVINQPNNTNNDVSHHRSNSESLDNSRHEAVITKKAEMTSINPSNPIASSEPGLASRIIVQPNHTDSDSGGYNEESEEEWPLADEPETAATPVGNPSKSSSQNEDSEYDMYDYDTDTMPIDGLNDDEFDCFFSTEATDLLINKIYPGFGSYTKALEECTRSKKTCTESKKQPLTIKEIDDSQIPRVPAIAARPSDLTVNDFKPNVEWYQDAEFVYMNIALNVDDYIILMEFDRIYFEATYDERLYKIDELLFTSIYENRSTYYKSSVKVHVKMEKMIKRNKWKHIFRNDNTVGWVKKSSEHLDEDTKIPDVYWDHQLNPGLAIKEPEIPSDFTFINNYNNPNDPIYPEGYVEYLPDSDDDSDAVCNDNDE